MTHAFSRMFWRTFSRSLSRGGHAARLACLLACVSIGTAGCELERGESIFEDQDQPDAARFDADGPDAGAPLLGAGPGAGTLGGTWLRAHEASTCVLGREQVTIAYYLVDIEQEGGLLRERHRLCDTALSPILGLRPVVPRAVIDSIEVVTVDTGLATGLRPGASYTSSTELGLWGLALDDPLEDPFPSSADDPAIVDADDDGNPGVTLPMEGTECRRYMVQRQRIRYTGALTAANQIDGHSTLVNESFVVGASSGLCAISPRLEPNDAFNRFAMYRVDGLGGAYDADLDADGTITCAEAEHLFELAWPPRDANDDNCS